ncbi:MAG: 16S rRNA (guanine(527)-N(7))-methyltransferase RsmG [Pseudomonadota bacterium]
MRNLGLKPALRDGLEQLGVAAGEEALDALVDYVGEIATWNRAYNLTAVREPAEMVTRHLLDSASVLRWVRGPEVLDVGSGAGLPGVPLAILDPALAVTLLDSNGKKARFLRHVKRRLDLANVAVEQARIEAFAGDAFATIVSRAFAEPATFLTGVRHLAGPETRIVAMQGRRAERPEVDGFRLLDTIDLAVPGLDAQRHILIYGTCPESSQ